MLPLGDWHLFLAHSKSAKGEKEAILKEALSNARLWEMRYQAVEKSRQEYRENTRRIVAENEQMQNAVNQVSLMEDTLQVTGAGC